MCATMTMFCSYAALTPRELVRTGISRLYHQRRKSCRVKSGHALERFLSPLSATRSWGVLVKCQNVRDASSSGETPAVHKEKVPNALTKEQAKEVALRLNAEERDVLLTAIQECKSEEERAGYEGQLAALRWRSKFGRPSKVLTLGDVDPTGKFCPVPEDWLLRKCAENVTAPTTKQLIFVALANAIPFIGFGFLDNFIMIVAGDQIEMIFNRRFPISTMTAAALGNTVSDVIGIGSVHYVELLALKIGFKPPTLSPAQLNVSNTKIAANLGRIFGVTVGCLLGMTPIPLINLFHGSV